jgi:hypothetical protein
VISNFNHNKSLKEYHLGNGGLRKSFETFTNYLDNNCNMTFLNDTGKNFSYYKEISDTNDNKGTLIIGIKLDITNTPLIYSSFRSKYKGEFSGVDVTGVDFESIESISRCINISLERLKTQGILNYQNLQNNIINAPILEESFEKWNEILQVLENSAIYEEIIIYVNEFFIPDNIDPQKYIENYDILNNPFNGVNLDGEYGTPSAKSILYIPPLFSKLFVAGYPDVYQWFQKNADSGKIEIANTLKKISNEEFEAYARNPRKVMDFYRSIIKQFKNEHTNIETTFT